MPEEKKRSGKKVNAWIPDDLYFKVDDLKYKTWTEAIVTGLELLVKSTGKVQTGINEVQESTEKVQTRINEVQESTEKVQESTDKSTMDDSEVQKVQESTDKSTVDDSEVQKKVHDQELELIKIKAHFEGLQRLIEEKERLIEEKDERIKDLTREVTTLNGFAHYFKTVEVKQIEAPAAEKTKPWWKFW